MTIKKNLFVSKTAISIYATLIMAIAPTLTNWANQSRVPTSGEMFQVVMLLVSSGAGLMFRYAANETTFTPDFMPGRNAADIPEIKEVEPEKI